MHRVDLLRARMDEATACFILADRYTDNVDQQDAITFLRALAVQKFNPDIKSYGTFR